MAQQRAISKPQGFINLEMHGNSQQVEAMLDHLDRALDPTMIGGRFLATTVNPYIRMRARNRFASEGDDAVGGRWTPLKAATENFRTQAGYGGAHPINRRTGELEAYITSSPLDIRIEPAIGATLVMPGNPPSNSELRKKVATAQKGDSRTAARPVMAVDATDLGFVLTGLVECVTRGLL